MPTRAFSIRDSVRQLVLISPYFKLSKTFYERWLKNRLNHSANSDISRYGIQRRDKKIAKIEQEYRDLMTAWPRNVARLSEIISELGKLWNAKVRDDEQNGGLAERDGAQDMEQLQKAVNMIMCKGKKKMAKAQSQEEIHKVFIEGLDKVRCLMDE